jgi:hypothetical protein
MPRFKLILSPHLDKKESPDLVKIEIPEKYIFTEGKSLM